MTPLPIDTVLPDLIAALSARGQAVLQAPPGAGKTTRVPLTLLEAGISPGKIVMLEPRRLATRAAASRMADTLKEPLGQTIGHAMRGESTTSATTKIDVVTEGILTRMLQSDPALTDVGCVIFDEFHERSLNSDLGLALTSETRAALRDDLLLLVMSATLDAGPVAALIDAPTITSEGQSFPVDIRWRDRPLGPKTQLETATAELTREAIADTTGGILVFLPGAAEITRTAALLSPQLPGDCQLFPLYGALPAAQQAAALRPLAKGRKIVLATSIAETSLTIDGIRTVVDAGRARRARFDPRSAMTRLVTERVSRAEATQRTGRAGRVAPGVAYRLWSRAEEGALAAFAPPEIETADLTPLALDLADWGAAPADLAFLTPPPQGPFTEAQSLLTTLGALDDQHRITPHGRTLARLPLHPRLGHMLTRAGKEAAPLAALLGDRDPLRGAPADLTLRLKALANPKGFRADHPYDIDRPTLDRIQAETKRLARRAPPDAGLSPGAAAALAYPDRIGLRRKGEAPRFHLSGGRGAALDPADPMAGTRLLVATDLDGRGSDPRIRAALPLTEPDLRATFPDAITWHTRCTWSRRHKRVEAREEERCFALILNDRLWPDATPEAIATAALDGIHDLGLAALNWTPAATRLRNRIEAARKGNPTLPDCSDQGLLDRAKEWLLPHLGQITLAADFKKLDLGMILANALTYDQTQSVNASAPPSFTSPLGRKIPIDYTEDTPSAEVRLQEMFGTTAHPTTGPDRRPLRLTLLSPAGRPLQTTMDLPGFWTTSYTDVRKDMRGRYPKHPWPEDPTTAAPTTRRKPRG